MKSIIWIRLVIFFLVTALTGCATVAPPAPETRIPFEKREPELKTINSWHISGKIAVQSTQNSGSATIDWVQRNKNFTISLMGPLGTNGVKLSGSSDSVTLKAANGKEASANSPEQLLKQQMGWDLPVSNISYWIRGIPVPGVPFTSEKDNAGRLSALNQQGWNIRYPSYTSLGKMDVPSRIFLSSPALKVKIIVYSWKALN